MGAGFRQIVAPCPLKRRHTRKAMADRMKALAAAPKAARFPIDRGTAAPEPAPAGKRKGRAK